LVAIHDTLSSVIGGESEGEIPSESIKELSQILGASSDIVFRVIEVSHIHPHGGLWHQLHQSDGSGPRDRMRVKVRFGFDDGPYQGGVDAVFS